MELSLLFKGMIIGLSIAAPVGPIGVLCIRRALADGGAAGLLSGLGAATADAVGPAAYADLGADAAVAIARNDILRTSKRVGRTIWRRWSGYHRRSRTETKMHCVKLLGQRLSARDFDPQVAEFQVRVAVLNGFTARGIPVTEVVG